jgi:hypothetical protein
MKLNITKKLAILAIAFAAVMQATPSNAIRVVASGIRNSEGKKYNLLLSAYTKHGINYTSYYLSEDEKWNYDKDIEVFASQSYGDGVNCPDGERYPINAVDHALISSSWNSISPNGVDDYIYIYATHVNCKNQSIVAETLQVSADDKGGFITTEVIPKTNKTAEIKNNKGEQYNLLCETYGSGNFHGYECSLSLDEKIRADDQMVFYAENYGAKLGSCPDKKIGPKLFNYSRALSDFKVSPYPEHIYIHAVYKNCEKGVPISELSEVIKIIPDDKGGFLKTNIKGE